MHAWNIKKPDRVSPSRRCLKCDKIQIQYHLLHAGLELYFFDKERPQKTHKQLKKEGRLLTLLFFLPILALIIYILAYSTITIPKQFITPLLQSIYFLLGLFIYAIISAELMWRNIKGYAVPVELENKLTGKIPEPKDWRDDRRKAEQELMHSFVRGEISQEEYTAKRARI